MRSLSWRAPAALATIASVLAVTIALLVSGSGGSGRALAAVAPGEVVPQTDAAAPAREMLMIGSSPGEAPQEAWAVGKLGAQGSPAFAIVRYAAGSGWTLAPSILDSAGNPLSGFEPDRSPLTGSITNDGGGALLGEAPAGSGDQLLLTRDPGQPFAQTSIAPPLEAKQRLFDPNRAPMVAALEEGGSAGALVVPVGGEEASVLHWSDSSHTWTSEPIEVPASSRGNGFEPLAISASSSTNAWLLARLGNGTSTLALFHREAGGGGEVWQPVPPAPGEPAGAALQVPLQEGQSTPLASSGKGALTVSSQGVWVDAERADTLAPITMFFDPGSDSVRESWCGPSIDTKCGEVLGESLPTGATRSFAWANPSTPYGERVITGLGEGVSLRLEGSTFQRVLALGSSTTIDVGASEGAAFASAKEGWLGSNGLPVHLTLEPELGRLETYPTPFHHPLLAIAPQPGAPVGAASSEALAVGEEGDVARYSQANGWQPESLLNVAGVRQTPQLRAVAWPLAGRAYAVGLESMWLWRGETGLWEKDPATPINFRGDLLGIAFDSANASRGYAVGQDGVLLRFGKTWTQEATCGPGVSQPCLPSEVANASFTSVAFAGSEAIVAFRIPHFTFSASSGSELSYTGGLLVNSGSGWQVDTAAASSLAGEPQDIPWAVAGLPDGGAAFSAESAAKVPRVFERNGPGAAWEATAQPYPGFSAAGSLGLFREGGSLRVIGAGAAPNTTQADSQTPSPAGSPPPEPQPYPVASPPAFLLRQTANGWSDEEHDHDEIGPPVGAYKLYDKGYEPDPAWAVEVSPGGDVGWAVGGFPPNSARSGLETADISRYSYPNAESTAPPGTGSAAITHEAGTTPIAIGGGAQCGAPCAARANAHLGPDEGLSGAIRQAQKAGAAAFVYTGPRVTTGATSVKATLEVPYEEEFQRYAALLAPGGAGAMAVPSGTDRVHGNECFFNQTFKGLPFTGLESCEDGHADYYAEIVGSSPHVRVIVIDNTIEVDATQLSWLQEQLGLAAGAAEPAIVVGNANLLAQEARGEANAASAVSAIIAGKAAGYFFDSPEQNVKLHMRGTGIMAYGSGTLGYVSVQSSQFSEFIGASGFLLAQVGTFKPSAGAGQPNAKVSAPLIPSIGEDAQGTGELSLEAQQGTLLRRSEVAKFAALARRPRAGNEASENNESEDFSDAFTPIPAECKGADCPESGGDGIVPEYEFTSSNEEIGRFVQPELHSAEANAIKFNASGEPVFEGGQTPSAGQPFASKSGLFCALNAGQTTVTIKAGGFSASLVVDIQKGSVRRPCGTTPEKAAAAQETPVPAPAPPPPSPAPIAASTPTPAPLPVPPPPVVPAPPTPPRAAVPAPPFFIQPVVPFAVVPFVPPPPPPPANPTPPSGTSPVTSPVEAAQKEEEREEATESVSNQAVAYSTSEHDPMPEYLLGVAILAAFAGAAGARRRPRRGRREVRVAPATNSGARMQRRMRPPRHR